MSPLFSVSALRQIEIEAKQQGVDLIARAGQQSAEWLLSRFANATRYSVMVGPGNNGLDALACAAILHAHGKVIELRLSKASKRFSQITNSSLQVCEDPYAHWGEVIIDGLFGIGLNRSFDPVHRDLLAAANGSNAIKIALDIPSGLNADNGVAIDGAFLADITLTMIGDKPGLHTADGRDHSGEVIILDLGLSEQDMACGQLINQRDDLPILRRKHQSHKGSFGTVAVIGGSVGMVGAAWLAGRAAINAGAGKVYVGSLQHTLDVDPLQPELMLLPAQSLLSRDDLDVISIGPGLGKSPDALVCMKRVLQKEAQLVIDADGLNLLAMHQELQQLVAVRQRPALLTPHPAEAARLLGCTTAQIQADRVQATRALAKQFNATVALKGSGTVCSAGDIWSINGSGNALLANAGQGDVLCGLSAALVAQGLAPFPALQLACYLHGNIADEALVRYPGAVTLTASQVIAQLSRAVNLR
ncbi:bifunctional ADP-dependent NAD(P)H-hydrate dehydratase/NAD(P)H-hydrate epimerase [Andreprevotia chitinilytica]|uniref:bifunctional ADP-dependent NAD(P)H-hydrate dehydratase/NAD(P)H-hydrate epimerase n=1 Tax=Andreprevotia chitinilytica TaxID=396808 RepID=UPI0005509F3E|nr:bifunctional ADP-dependent NAD(P)H-hydrate dehydratase/NAD(P)H-hydrate epimerase [Andreprevotia chitinilytica]